MHCSSLILLFSFILVEVLCLENILNSIFYRRDADCEKTSSLSQNNVTSSITSSSSLVTTQFTISTVHTTSISTVIKCASTVEDCPAHSTILTTLTVPVYTTICPVTESATSSQWSTIQVESKSLSSDTTLSTRKTGYNASSSTTFRAISTSTGFPYSTTAVVSDHSPGCAYVIASDLGANALCLADYCNCRGTIAPLLTSTLSGTLISDCKYQAQPTKNICPTNFPAMETKYTTTTLFPPPVTVTTIVVVSKRDGACSTAAQTSQDSFTSSFTLPSLLSSSSVLVSSGFSLLLKSNNYTLFSIEPPSLATSRSILTSTSLVSLLTMKPSPVLATTAAMAVATPESACVISGHCNTYKLLACPGGNCFCGQDINNQPVCFHNQYCENTKSCNSDTDCAANEACGVKDCCGGGAGRCLARASGCQDSPAAKDPYWLPYSYGCIKHRLVNDKRLAC